MGYFFHYTVQNTLHRTVRYLYLEFDDARFFTCTIINLRKINTQKHPIPAPQSSIPGRIQEIAPIGIFFVTMEREYLLHWTSHQDNIVI